MTPERWKKIEQLYHAALERDESQRAAYLQEVCAGDDELRREVESLLAHDESAGKFLEKPAMEAAARMIADDERQISLVGTRLGSYQITSLLGAGGMGVVYKARDTRLDRNVAIKVLPAHLADQSKLRERFEREARTIAGLNHPHICTLYDIGRQDGIDYLVMEYLEGQTLAQRLEMGSLPMPQVLQYAIEISDALDKAHCKGITHRDLKPGNVMLTKQGTKLLDFGLAKLKQEAMPDTPDSQLPTLQTAITGEGAILGTLQYMAPEQVEARAVDARTDIFSFGVMVYEMATGRKAFEGKTSAGVMAKIMEAEPPPMASLQPMTPPALERTTKRCLAKDPDDRWQTARDLNQELKWMVEAGSQIASGPAAAGKTAGVLGRRAPIVGLGILLLGAAMGSLAIWNLKRETPQPSGSVARMEIPVPGERLQGADMGTSILALSPDGTRLVLTVRSGGTTQLYIRRLDQLEFKMIPGTEGGTGPFFSPDSRWIGFYSETEEKVKKVSVEGGAPITVCDSSQINGATWGPDGTIIYSHGAFGDFGLYRVSSSGGTPKVLTTPDPKNAETGHSWPAFLPDGKGVLFTIHHTNEAPEDSQIVVQSLQTSQRRVLIRGGTWPVYASTGHLVYVRGGTVMAVPFDLAQWQVTGDPVPVSQVATFASAPHFALSDTGSLAYWLDSLKGRTDKLVWVDRKGAGTPLQAPPGAYQFPRLSPDAQKIALQVVGAKTDIWIYDVSRNSMSRVTFDGDNTWPIWTPNGKQVTFTSNAAGHENIYWKPVDGSGEAQRLTTSDHVQTPRSWSPDGKVLVFSDTDPETGEDIWFLPLQAGSAPKTFLRTPFDEGWASLSPDGRWLAYVSKEMVRAEVFVQQFPEPSGRTQVSTDGGTEPVWSRNGKELFYRSGNRMMVVDTITQPSLHIGQPRQLFDSADYLRVSTTPNYDVSPDGQRFLMIQAGEQQSNGPRIDVVLNWFEELKQKVPTGKRQ